MRKITTLILCVSLLFSCKNNPAPSKESESSHSDNTRMDKFGTSDQDQEQARLDSIRQLGVVKDSFIRVKQEILNSESHLARGGDEYKQLESTYVAIDDAVSSMETSIMEDILIVLKPTNKNFKSLIKDINGKKEKLEKIADKFSAIANVVHMLTNILTSPILSGILPRPTPQILP